MPVLVHYGNQGAVGVEFGFEQTAPRHHCIGVVDAAVTVRLCVFHERCHVGQKRFAELLFRAELDAKFRRQLNAAFERQQVVQSLHPSRLGCYVAVQPAGLFWNQICLGSLAEVGTGLFFEGHLREEATGVQVLLHREAAPPVGLAAAEVFLVQVLHCRGFVNKVLSVQQTQHYGRDDG